MSSGRTAERSRTASARRAVAIWAGKAAGTGARRLGSSGGAGIAGRVALAIAPGAFAGLAAELPRGSIIVTGSAGQGTTCQLLAQVMRAAGRHPVLSADDGSARPGLVTAMVAQAGLTGHLRRDKAAVGLLAADVDTVAEIARHVPGPGAVVCTNIFRDEGDRGRDPGASTMLVERAIRQLPATTTLILNADDPRVACLAPELPNPRLYFGISDPAHGRVRADSTAGRPRCPRCDGRLSYARTYYGHLGHWACDRCGLSRPQPEVSATKVRMNGSPVTRLQLATIAGPRAVEIPLLGLHNAYSALAAVAAATACQLPAWSLAATGTYRMERIGVAGHEVYLTGAQDALGFTVALRAILGAAEPRHLLLGLDDDAGQRDDPGWLWDVDLDSLAGLAPAPVICGNRAADLAVRLKYAGWLGDAQDLGESAGAIIEPDVSRAFPAALAAAPAGQPLWVVSTPACLDELRRWLRRQGYIRDQRLRGDDGGSGPHAARAYSPRPRAPGHHALGPYTPGPRSPGPQPSAPPRSGRRPRGRVGRGWHGRHRRPTHESEQTGGGR